MSRTFFELTALVLASFALGLLVGWLAWNNRPNRTGVQADQPGRPPSAAGKELPNWQVEQTRPSPAPSPADRRPPADPGPTVVLGPGRAPRPQQEP